MVSKKERKFGREEGAKIGRKEGKIEEKLTTATKLLKLGMSIEQIIEITELTKEDILNLKNDATQ